MNMSNSDDKSANLSKPCPPEDDLYVQCYQQIDHFILMHSWEVLQYLMTCCRVSSSLVESSDFMS